MEGTSSASSSYEASSSKSSSSKTSSSKSSSSKTSSLPSAAEKLFNFSTLHHGEKLHQALCSSSTMSRTRVKKQVSQADADEEDLPLRILKGKETKTGESSRSRAYCRICMDAKAGGKMFWNQNCSHIFCNSCIGRHVGAKIEENIPVVKCPYPCSKAVIEPQHCLSVIPKEVSDRWGNALCQTVVLEAEKFYCPFKDCSAMMIYDAKEVFTASECPHCNRLFCALCKVSWHAGKTCEEFQRLEGSDREREETMVKELAKAKHWKRCPKCSFYVERTEGCSRISCRCGNEFCYACGSSWDSNKHYLCRTC